MHLAVVHLGRLLGKPLPDYRVQFHKFYCRYDHHKYCRRQLRIIAFVGLVPSYLSVCVMRVRFLPLQ